MSLLTILVAEAAPESQKREQATVDGDEERVDDLCEHGGTTVGRRRWADGCGQKQGKGAPFYKLHLTLVTQRHGSVTVRFQS